MEKIVEWYESVRWGRVLAAIGKQAMYSVVMVAFIICAPIDKEWLTMTGGDIIKLMLPIMWLWVWWAD